MLSERKKLFRYENGNIYYGESVTDIPNGSGVMIFYTFTIFKEIRDNGTNRYRWFPYRSIYNGEWNKGFPVGKCKIRFYYQLPSFHSLADISTIGEYFEFETNYLYCEGKNSPIKGFTLNYDELNSVFTFFNENSCSVKRDLDRNIEDFTLSLGNIRKGWLPTLKEVEKHIFSFLTKHQIALSSNLCENLKLFFQKEREISNLYSILSSFFGKEIRSIKQIRLTPPTPKEENRKEDRKEDRKEVPKKEDRKEEDRKEVPKKEDRKEIPISTDPANLASGKSKAKRVLEEDDDIVTNSVFIPDKSIKVSSIIEIDSDSDSSVKNIYPKGFRGKSRIKFRPEMINGSRPVINSFLPLLKPNAKDTEETLYNKLEISYQQTLRDINEDLNEFAKISLNSHFNLKMLRPSEDLNEVMSNSKEAIAVLGLDKDLQEKNPKSLPFYKKKTLDDKIQSTKIRSTKTQNAKIQSTKTQIAKTQGAKTQNVKKIAINRKRTLDNKTQSKAKRPKVNRKRPAKSQIIPLRKAKTQGGSPQ